MLALFCLRLAFGLIGSLLILNPARINPRFFRVHFLTALGLTALAAVFLRETADLWLWAALAAGGFFAFLGSVSWSLDRAPGGRPLIVLTALAGAAALLLAELAGEHPAGLGWQLAGDFASAALLGTATTAMLMGHSYLIAPAMSLTPLLRLLAAVAVAAGLRLALAGVGLWCWTEGHSLANLTDVTVLWLPVR